MTIPTFDGLVFDERSHTYTLNGMKLPSVTTIMRPLSNEYYGSIDRSILDTAAKRGTTVHQAIENWLKFGYDDIPEEHSGYYSAFKNWLDENSPRLIEAESRVYHKVFRYAGTADLPCIINSEVICVDFKTSVNIVEMLARVQLEAYAKAYESHGFKFSEKAIVQLKSDGCYKMVRYKAGDGEAWEVFCGLLTAYNYLSKYGNK